jgi:hypothetical protein
MVKFGKKRYILIFLSITTFTVVNSANIKRISPIHSFLIHLTTIVLSNLAR